MSEHVITKGGPRVRRFARPDVLGAVGVFVTAAILYSRFGIHGRMIRDSSIYIYGGQQAVQGRAPYVSEMDPKGPISSLLASAGVAVAKLFGRSDIIVVRAEFCGIAVFAVLGVYLLVLALRGSVVAAIVAAAVFASFENFAYNALAQTDGHIPGIVFFVFALWLTVRRRWYLAGFAAALAFLTWQPLFVFPLVVLACAVAWSAGQRRRAAGRNLLGAATPVLALVIYYSIGGHLRAFVDGLVVYPVTGVQRLPTTVPTRLRHFFNDIPDIYGDAAILFWVGIALLLGAALWTLVSGRSRLRTAVADPLVLLLSVSFVLQVAYLLYDYIGYPHTWPLLPYAAVGFGVATAALLQRLPALGARVVTAVALTAAAALAIVCGFVYSERLPTDGQLLAQQSGACALETSLAPGTPLWVIDDPVPLVLLHRRQPDNFPYVGGGLDIWKVNHTRGGFAGWTRQIVASRASIVVLDAWVAGRYKQPMIDWLIAHDYRPGWIGGWNVYMTAAARQQMAAHSIKLEHHFAIWPYRTDGKRYRNRHCPGIFS